MAVVAGSVASRFCVDHQTWPTTSPNDHKHSRPLDETSPVRLKYIEIIDYVHPVIQNHDPKLDPKPWKAKWLIGKEWQEDEETLERTAGKDVMSNDQQHEDSTTAIASVSGTAPKGKRVADDLDRTFDKKPKITEETIDAALAENDSTMNHDPPLRDPSFSQNQHVGSDHGTEHYIDTRQPHEFIDLEDKLLWVRLTDDSRFSLKVRAQTKGSTISAMVANRLKLKTRDMCMLADGHRCWPGDWTVSNMGLWFDLSPAGSTAIENERYVDIQTKQWGGKPVIYLYPPEPTSIDVALSLCPQCKSTRYGIL
jgi:hypothetical protein